MLLAAVSWPEYVDGVSNLAHKIVDLTDARALVLLVEMDERVFVVVRSRTERIDAAAVAAALGGGGHAQAASAISRTTSTAAREHALAALRQTRGAEPLARDVMSTPARAVEPDASVRDAMTLCQRHGQSGVFVVDERPARRRREPRGSRQGDRPRPRACARARDHEQPGRERARGRDAARAPRARHGGRGRSRRRAPRRRARRRRQSRRSPARARGRSGAARAKPPRASPSELRSSRACAAIVDAVAALGERADGVYLVGGTIRDILLGEESFDVDIAVEGDAIAFAYALAGALGGRATPHQKFGTAIVSYGDGERIDVVTTRTEFYDAPGALPTVERAGLREDLFRRDFTINAMAASLGAGDFGRLVDPFGGRADLDARVLRVLHNLSFIDDPTRIFRGIRYEARYGFRFDEHTARLLRGCIEMGLVGDLSSSRLRDELVALLEDPGAADGIRRLGELGADRAIHPHLRGDDDAAALFARASALRDELGVEVPSWRIGIAALARELTSDEAYDWLERLKVRRRDVERIVGAVDRRAAHRRAAPLRVARRRRRSSRSRTRSRPTRRSSRSRTTIGRSCATTSTRLRDVRLEIGGADLIALGLPESPRSARSSARSAGGSSTASSTDARRSSPRRESSWRRARQRDGRQRKRDRRALRPRPRRGRAGRHGRRRDEVRLRDEMAALAEAGVAVVGENRAQDLEQKHALYGDAFRWHFIGHLQSNKVKVVNRSVRARPLGRLRLRRAARRRFRRSSR